MHRIHIITLLLALCLFLIPTSMSVHGVESISDISDVPDVTKDEIGNFDELKAWMKGHKFTGGTAILTSNITVPANVNYQYSTDKKSKMIYIEAGAYSIYVEGELELNPFVTITGDGGDDGILHVKPNGTLYMLGVNITGQEGVNAIVQQEGSVLAYADMTEEIPFVCVGDIVNAENIVAYPSGKAHEQIIIIPYGTDFDKSMLPQTIVSYSYFNGEQSWGKLPIEWESESLPKERMRTRAYGVYSNGVVLVGEYKPQCLVVFANPVAPVFTDCYIYVDEDEDTIDFFAYGAKDGGMVQLQMSTDGENWEDMDKPKENEEELIWSIDIPNTDSPENVEKSRYFSMMHTTTEGAITYSDTLEITADDEVTGSDVEGGRGGETLPGVGGGDRPPITLPPPTISPSPDYGDSDDDGDDYDYESKPEPKPEQKPQTPPTSQIPSTPPTSQVPQTPPTSQIPPTPQPPKEGNSNGTSSEDVSKPATKDETIIAALPPTEPPDVPPPREVPVFAEVSKDKPMMSKTVQLAVGIISTAIIVSGVAVAIWFKGKWWKLK